MLLLLTGTINSSIFNNTNIVISSTNERYKQYYHSIKKYIETGIFSSIVFAENSGYSFPVEEIKNYALKFGTNFEFVPVTTDIQKTIELGKSYGEADCIEQGLEKSELAKKEEYFIKCTGRVFIKNIEKLCKKNKNCNKFLFRDDMEWCYTLIFQMNIAEYKKYFYQCKSLCNEKEGIDIEKSFYKIIMQNNIKFKCFRSYPNVEGLCGTTGKAYNEKYHMKNFFTKLGLFSHNPFNKIIYRTCASTFLNIRNKILSLYRQIKQFIV